MKKVVVSIFMLVSLVCAKDTDIHHKHTKMFQSVVTNQAVILQNTKAKKFCPNCGMTLPMFYKTNHAGDLDGHTKQYCSIHCLVEDNLKNHNKIKNASFGFTFFCTIIIDYLSFYKLSTKKVAPNS